LDYNELNGREPDHHEFYHPELYDQEAQVG